MNFYFNKLNTTVILSLKRIMFTYVESAWTWKPNFNFLTNLVIFNLMAELSYILMYIIAV